MRRRIWPDLMLVAAPFVALAALALVALLGARPDALPEHGGAAGKPASLDVVGKGKGGDVRPALSDAALGFASRENYAAVVARDLFAGDRRPPPRRQRGGGSSPRLGQPAAPRIDDLVLVGVIEGEQQGYRALIAERRAVGATRILAPGERIGGYEVVAISPMEVTLRQGTREVKLRLGFRSGAAAASAADSRFRLSPGMKVPRSRSDPRAIYQPVKRDAAGRPTPAAHQRRLRGRVRQWQRKLQDYGVAGGTGRRRGTEAAGTRAPSRDRREPVGDGPPKDGGG